MKLNPKLNLVIPVERENGTVYVHASHISREVFDEYFYVLGRTFTAIYAGGLTTVAGPRLASLMLKKIAGELGILDDVENGLLMEIRRLANVIVPGQPMMPLQEAFDKSFFDADDVSEVENALVFFIVASAMHKRTEIAAVLKIVGKMWSAQTTSLNCTEYSASLRTSTVAENTGAMAAE